MSIKKVVAAMMMGAALVAVSPVVDLPPYAISVAHAQDVWAYTRSDGVQYFVMSETIKKYSDGGINCRVKAVANGQAVNAKTYNFTPRYSNGVLVDWNHARQTGVGWEDLGPVGSDPFAKSVINVCLRYVK